ncbi:MAG TPA: hypothetical protein ENJ33_08340 [Thiothrix sp.]|nr:hypothetical protein [Thiothrix sp.]
MRSRQYSISAHTPIENLDYSKLELVIEAIASKGCIAVNKLLYTLKKQQIPEQLSAYSFAERDFIYHELKAVMAIYEGRICHL